MSIHPNMVRELREKTGAGIMECKKALIESQGDIQAAADLMRKKGLAGAEKKSSRIAAEGVIVTLSNENQTQAVMLELNSETDFVSRGDDFKQFASEIASVALSHQVSSVDELSQLTSSGKTVEEKRQELIAKIGENITLRRVSLVQTDSGSLGIYQHGDRIGVLVNLSPTGLEDLAKDIAMQVAANNPRAISVEDFPQSLLEKEKSIFHAQTLESGKPEAIVDKIVEGKTKKYLKENTLLGQAFIKNPDVTIEQLIKQSQATVHSFCRFEVGEGIEKKKEDFKKEVEAQAKQVNRG